MNRDKYLADKDVCGFLAWAAELVGGCRRVNIEWRSPQGSGFEFQCESLREACENYRWPMVGDSKGFDDTASMFEEWQRVMTSSAGAPDQFRKTAIEVTEWGRMAQVRKDLKRMGEPELEVLFADAKLLEPAKADLRGLKRITYMNSGYSKIYAMMLKEFPIYDSRVACALTSLIRAYCVEKRKPGIPELLRLGVMYGRGTSDRDPSIDGLQFPTIWVGTKSGRARHASSNVRAAWLLSKLAKREGRNGGWPKGREALALQSALFMVGYQKFDEKALQD